MAQNSSSTKSEGQVNFAWLPFLDGIYYQFDFAEPQSDAAKVCKQIVADKNHKSQLPNTRTSNISTGIQFYPLTINSQSHLGQSLKKLPNERNIEGIYANPNAMSGPNVNLPVQTFTPEQDRKLLLRRHPELGLFFSNRPVKRGVLCAPDDRDYLASYGRIFAKGTTTVATLGYQIVSISR
jgi:hypothetical protein